MTRLTQILKAAFICAASFLFTTTKTLAQVPDPGFENWDSVDNGSFKTYLPAGWGDFLNQVCAFENKPWAVTRTSDAHSGSYAIQLKNIALASGTSTSLMSRSGKPEEFNNKIPVTARHTKLEGYFKYTSPGNDTFTISVLMMKGENFIGFADYARTKEADTYTKFSIPIIYTAAASEMPDSAIIIINAGSSDHFTEGTTLLLDDVSFNLSSGLQQVPFELKAEINLWPNPATDLVNLSLKGNLQGTVNVEVVNLLGQTIKQTEYPAHGSELQDTLQLGSVPKGLLFIKVTDENGSKAVRLVHE